MLEKAKEITWLVSKDFVAGRNSQMEKKWEEVLGEVTWTQVEKNKPQVWRSFGSPKKVLLQLVFLFWGRMEIVLEFCDQYHCTYAAGVKYFVILTYGKWRYGDSLHLQEERIFPDFSF